MRPNHLGTTLEFEQDMKNAVLLGLPVKRTYLATLMTARYANPRVCDKMIRDGDPIQYWTGREGRTIRSHFHFRSAMSRPGLVANLSYDSFMQVLIIPCSSRKVQAHLLGMYKKIMVSLMRRSDALDREIVRPE